MPEPNTSEIVDYIIITAKEAAEAEIVEETEENTGAEDFKEEEV